MSDQYLKPYFKAWVAFIAAVLICFIAVIEPALEDNVISAREWLSAIVAMLGVVGVWMAPNTPYEPVDVGRVIEYTNGDT